MESARAAAARVGSDLAAVNQFLRAAGPRTDGPTLAEGLRVRPGLEAALAAALGPRLSAAVVEDVAAGQRVLDRAGERGGLALLASAGAASPERGTAPVRGATRAVRLRGPDARAARPRCPPAGGRLAGRLARRAAPGLRRPGGHGRRPVAGRPQRRAGPGAGGRGRAGARGAQPPRRARGRLGGRRRAPRPRPGRARPAPPRPSPPPTPRARRPTSPCAARCATSRVRPSPSSARSG